jgi:membrane protease YdiL (CAAX protease family)
MTPVYPNVKQSIGLFLLVFLLQVVLVINMVIAIFISGKSDLMNNPLVMSIPSYLPFIFLMLWGYRKTKLPLLKIYRFEKFDIAIFISLLFLILGVGIICSEIDNISKYFFPMPEFIRNIMKELVSNGTSSIIALVILAPVIEELFFRGFILHGLLSQYSIKKSVLVSTLLFMLIHLNPYQFAGAFLFGIISAYIFLATRSLLPCILGHALYNALPFLIKYFLKVDIPGFTKSADPFSNSFQPLWLDGLGIAFLLLGLYFLITYYRKYRTADSEVPEANFIAKRDAVMLTCSEVFSGSLKDEK